MTEVDGWTYREKPQGGDARKIVTLEQDGMVWVGIRAFNHATGHWMNNNEPETAHILAWRDLNQPANGRWDRGLLVLPTDKSDRFVGLMTAREPGTYDEDT